jgi:GT2 family glycosyltransferase
MLFSILICTRNRRKELTLCLNSLHTNNYLDRIDCEVIVIDNASDHATVYDICSKYSITYFRAIRKGKSIGLNIGVDGSNGTYLIFIDDDVVIRDQDWADKLISNFAREDNVGYVSGNVKAISIETEAEISFENRGGLSKGQKPRIIRYEDFRKHRLVGYPVRLMAAGANCAIPRAVLNEIGYFDELLGPGSFVGGGESLDICYRVLRGGFTAIYDPNSIVYHQHPRSIPELSRKQFQYGVADGAIHTKFWIEYGDWRSFLEICYGRVGLLFFRLFLSLLGKYSLPPQSIIYGILGNILGPLRYFIAITRMKLTKANLYRN